MMRIAISMVTVGTLMCQGEVRIAPAGGAGKASVNRNAADDTGMVSAPLAGYAVAKSPLALRGLLGAPGATHYTEPYALPEGVQDIRIAPGHGWVLAVRGEGEPATAWIPEQGVERELGAVRGGDWMAAFSADGGSAVFVPRGGAHAYVFTGLPGEPELAADLVAADWPVDPAALAISEGGSLIAAATNEGGVWLVAAEGRASRRLLADGIPGAALAFAPGSERLLILDTAASRVLAVEAPRQGTGAVLAMEFVHPVSAASRVMARRDGTILVADAERGRVLKLDPAGWSVETIEAGGFEDAVELRWKGSLLLSGVGLAAGRVYTSELDGPRISYVPVASKGEVE